MTIKIEIAKPVAKKLKLLFYGPSGSGKTIAALSFPRVLMIDAESGSDLYAGRPGIAEFYRVRAKNLSEVNEVLDAIEKDAGKTWDTLVIDPVTVLYDVEKNVGSANNTKDMTFKAWGKVNNRMTALYNRLVALNVHVVTIAREAVEYAGEGQDLKKIGVKPEIDKKSVYMFDFVVRMKPDHSGIVEKSRGVELGKSGVLAKVDWSLFEPVASLYVKGEALKQQTDEEAAAEEINAWSADNAAEWQSKWQAQGMTIEKIKEALKITGRLSEWKGTVSQADAAIETFRKPVSIPPEVTASQSKSNLIEDTAASPAHIPDEAELRHNTLAELENQLVHLYKVEKRDYVRGTGKAAGQKWLGFATYYDSTETEQKIEVMLWPEDVTAIKVHYDFPMIDAPVAIPVVLTIKANAIRIKNDKVPPKQGANPFGGKPTESDEMFKALPGMSDKAKHQLAEKV